MLVAEPRDWHISFSEICGQQHETVSAFLEMDQNGVLVDGHVRGGINEITEDVPRRGPFVTVSDACAEQPVQTAGHQRQPQMAAHGLRGHRERAPLPHAAAA